MNRKIIPILVIVIIVGTIFYLESQKVSGPEGSVEVIEANVGPISDEARQTRIEKKEKQFESAKEITTPDGFINTEGIKVADLVGKKIILIDFWTYSCINCQRTMPYLNAWYEKYKDQGLEIIGVHTPEFDFEKDIENVKRATEQFEIKHPVVLDNDYSTWRAYKNRYWPRKYLIDIDGFIVYDHIGEGGYEETEKIIQQLLKERMETLGGGGAISTDTVDVDAEGVSGGKNRSPEIYFGASRNNRLGNGPQGTVGSFSFGEPDEIKPNILYLVGDWEITPEFAKARSESARIIFKYQAAKVFMVAGADDSISVSIKKNGEQIKSIGIQKEELYRIIEDEYGEHVLEIIFENPGVQVFTFTFG